jgi:predicted Zn-dependent peptidase
MIHQTFTLKNGLSVVLVDTKTFPTFTAMLLVGAGSRYENKENNGVAHFFEHMAFKGTKKYPNALLLSSMIEGLGGIFNAFTTKDHTGYWIKAPISHFETVVDVLADMIQNPLLLEEEIEREKGVIIEEINMYEDQPQYKVWELFEEMIYENNPLGYPTTGYKETVSKFTRQTFLDYMKDLYKPSNVVLVVAGGLSNKSEIRSLKHNVIPAKAGIQKINYIDSRFHGNDNYSYYLTIIQENFSSWKDGQKASFLNFADTQNSPQILIKTKKTEQAHLVLGYQGLNYTHPKRYIQSVLMTILGGGMSSRLFYQVRERRGLCYYIHSGSEPFSETGYVYTRAGLTVDTQKINEAIKVIIDEHQKVVGGDLKDEEIKKAKEMIKGQLILSMEDSHNLASFVGRKLIFEGKIVEPQEVIKKIDAITKKEIIDLAKKLFVKEKLSLTLLSPITEDKVKV